jgi:hypothetical protein
MKTGKSGKPRTEIFSRNDSIASGGPAQPDCSSRQLAAELEALVIGPFGLALSHMGRRPSKPCENGWLQFRRNFN